MFPIRAILLILAPLVLLAQDPDDVARQQTADAGIAAGKAQFQQTCGFCHGPDARGASGPDLLRSTLVSHDVDGNLIAPVVRNGRPEKGMPAFQVSDEQIRNIALFLHAAAKEASSVSQHIPSEYPLEKLMVGNTSDGKAYFDTHCSKCHSPSGDLAHIALKYKPFELQTRIAFPAGAKPTVIVRDREGQTFRGEQVYADEFLVSIHDSHGWLHTWPRKSVDIEVKDPLAQHEALLRSYTDKNVHDLFAYLETLK